MNIANADIEAARRVLGHGAPHKRMYNAEGEQLFGVQSCVHPLTGDGRPIEELLRLKENPGADAVEVVAVAQHWMEAPYYHHMFMSDPGAGKVGGHDLCYCGNTRGGKVHGPCWWMQWVWDAKNWDAKEEL